MQIAFMLSAIAMVGIHYPFIWLYQRWALAGLDDAVVREIHEALRPRMTRLLWAWLGSIATVSIAWGLWRHEPWGMAPMFTGALVAFHVLWWGFAVPVLRAMERELKSRGIERSPDRLDATRTASLAPRSTGDYLRPWMRPLPWLLGTGGIGFIAWRAWLYPPSDGITWMQVSIFTVSGLAFLLLWGWWLRWEIAQPYPADGDGEAARARMQAAESLRRFRVNGIYWLRLVASAAFFVTAALCIEQERGALTGPTLGLYGAIAGTILGSLGAAFGVYAGIRTHRAMRTGKDLLDS